jgi:MYXO-CTERM domain-containing protein
MAAGRLRGLGPLRGPPVPGRSGRAMIVAGAVLLALACVAGFWFGFATPLGAAIFAVAPPFLNTLQAGVQRRLSPDLWDAVFLPVLTAPVWLLPAVLGLILLAAGWLWRRRRHG